MEATRVASRTARRGSIRANKLAEKMAKTIGGEDVSDVALALAILTGGIVEHYTADTIKAPALVATIRNCRTRLSPPHSEARWWIAPMSARLGERKGFAHCY